jgi:uncharacterized membrane protein
MTNKKSDLSDWGDESSKEERFRRAIDSWVGTLTQVIGVIILLYAVFIDQFKNPALLPAATGILFLKTVAGRGKESG